MEFFGHGDLLIQKILTQIKWTSFIEDFQIYLDTIIKCDFDDFQGSESNFQNTDEIDTLHPCYTSSDYIDTENINDDVIKLFKQDIIDIGMSSVIHKCNGACYKNFQHNGCRMGFGYDNEGKQPDE